MIDCDPEDEEDLAFVQAFQAFSSVGRIFSRITLSSEDLRTLYAHLDKKTNYILPMSNIIGIKNLRRFLKNLQQRGHYEIRIYF